jgi:hypothetical protein
VRRFVLALFTAIALVAVPSATAWTWPLGGEVPAAVPARARPVRRRQHRGSTYQAPSQSRCWLRRRARSRSPARCPHTEGPSRSRRRTATPYPLRISGRSRSRRGTRSPREPASELPERAESRNGRRRTCISAFASAPQPMDTSTRRRSCLPTPCLRCPMPRRLCRRPLCRRPLCRRPLRQWLL